MRSPTIALFGAGAWGLALCSVLSRNQKTHLVWTRSPLARLRLESKVIKHPAAGSFERTEYICPTEHLTEAAKTQDWFIMTTCAGSIDLLAQLRTLKARPATITLGCKGLNPQDGSFLLDTWQNAFKDSSILQLAGPGFAQEIIRCLPTALIVACSYLPSAHKVARLLHNESLRIYPSCDTIGIQLGCTMKNPLAIAAGISDGLELGANARATLLTRGIHEFRTLGSRLDADVETLIGLSGLGDILLSALDNQSRNRQLGLKIAQGLCVDEAIKSISGHAEGVESTRLIHKIAQQHELVMPIIEQLHAILFEKMPPLSAVMNLMAREKAYPTQII